MKQDKLYELMGDIDPEIIADAAKPVPLRQKRGIKLALIAAVLAFCMLLTPVAGAFALAAIYVSNNTAQGGDNDGTTEDDKTGILSGGLVGELFGGVNWGAIGDAVGKDGNVNWGAIFDVLQGKEPTSSETIGMVGYEAVKLEDGSMKIVNFTTQSNETVIEIPETISGAKVTAIGKGAFSDNGSVTHISIPDTVTLIESNAFTNCFNLLTVDMSDYVTEIGIGAFEGCLSLTSIDLPQTLQYIGERAFASCGNLTNIRIPEGIGYIPDKAFCNTAITEITIPSSVQTIGDYAFAWCTDLGSVTFETATNSNAAGIKYIGASAFESTAISTITFPSTLTDIYDIDFKECMNLESVIFEGNAPTVHKQPNDDKSAPDNKNAPDYTVYYMLGAQGFSEPEWNGYACKLLEYQTDSYVKTTMQRRYSLVPWLRQEIIPDVTQPASQAVTVLDSYNRYQAYADVLPGDHYNHEYFQEYAIVLIKVKHTSYEQVTGLAGIGGQLYTTGGIYYLSLNPVVYMEYTATDVDSPTGNENDVRYTYVVAEVRRSDIRTDNVSRVGEVIVYDKDTQSESVYHRGLLDFMNDRNPKDGK